MRGSKPSARAKPARIDVRISPRPARAIRAAALKSAARAALDAARVRRSVALTIVITGDAALRRLNRDFLGVDAPTDVLSFISEDLGVEPSGGPIESGRLTPANPTGGLRTASTPTHQVTRARVEYLGDVIISLARAKAQSKSGGHPLIDELRLLVIHGVLHLLGYDHATPAQKKRMWAAQAKALKRAGASIEGLSV